MRFPTFAPLGLAFVLAFIPPPCRAGDDYKPGPDSLPQAGVPKGELIKDQYTAKPDSVFPGTEREYTIYVPPGLDKKKASPFMVFQDGVIYQAPTVFDNLIAKKEIPPLIGIFIKPGVVPAANANALARFNRSYEYDSVTDTYSRFLIDEFLPEIEKKHGLKLSEKGDDAAIAGNSSGGICAFMVAWHRPDRFRRVFTGVGTYVGIHGADQLPVLIRKMEPKPLRVYLQSGTGDNNLYCGDWWMANQMMERSLTWAGYDVNHTWGEGGHNQKHATAIFPEALKWLWRGWPEEGLRSNPANASRWKGYEVLGNNGWEEVKTDDPVEVLHLASDSHGNIFGINSKYKKAYFFQITPAGDFRRLDLGLQGSDVIHQAGGFTVGKDGLMYHCAEWRGKGRETGLEKIMVFESDGKSRVTYTFPENHYASDFVVSFQGTFFASNGGLYAIRDGEIGNDVIVGSDSSASYFPLNKIALSPDQTLVYGVTDQYLNPTVWSYQVLPDGRIGFAQKYGQLETFGLQNSYVAASGLCVDTEGRLYVATTLGVQVCDQAGRVNFIISTPRQPRDVCFGGKDLSELFITIGDKIYKRPMKVHGIVSGQMAPIKPAAPHL